MKKIPLGIQNFREIVEDDYVYVDKTQYIYELINGYKYYFLSRPRRFGKSLLLDVIGEVFKGSKELFKGLSIYNSDYAFEKFPVIRIDMSGVSAKTPDDLETSIIFNLLASMQKEGGDYRGHIPSDLLRSYILFLYEKYDKKIVVLIDEYDKPILDHLDNPQLADSNRKILKDFYGVIKSLDAYLRFTFLTGVSKFVKTSIFSELNNLFDITLNEKYANICGITPDDLVSYFKNHIDKLIKRRIFIDFKEAIYKISAWYDGYSWDGATRVINPFSLLSFIAQERFSAYWYASGTPQFLIELIKSKPLTYNNLNNTIITELSLDSADLYNIEAEPLLFQSGYLTIQEVVYTGGAAVYKLHTPNYEVRDAFSANIIAIFTGSGAQNTQVAQIVMKDALNRGEPERMLDTLRTLFSSIPYNLHINREAYYHSIFYAIMTVLGFKIESEVETANGRIDAVLDMPDKIYIMEFKYKERPPQTGRDMKAAFAKAALDEAMAQIEARGYSNKYIESGKLIYHVALAFLGRDDIEMRVTRRFEDD